MSDNSTFRPFFATGRRSLYYIACRTRCFPTKLSWLNRSSSFVFRLSMLVRQTCVLLSTVRPTWSEHYTLTQNNNATTVLGHALMLPNRVLFVHLQHSPFAYANCYLLCHVIRHHCRRLTTIDLLSVPIYFEIASIRP